MSHKNPEKSGQYTVKLDRREEPKGRPHVTLEVNLPGMKNAVARLKDLNIRLYVAKQEVTAFEKLGVFKPEYFVQRRAAIAEHEKERTAFRAIITEGIRVLELRDDLEAKAKTPAQRAQEEAAAAVHQLMTGCSGGRLTLSESWKKGLADAESVGDGNAIAKCEAPAATTTPPAPAEAATTDDVGEALERAFNGAEVTRGDKIGDAALAAVDEAQE